MNTRYSIPIVCTAVFVAMIFMVVVYIDPESFGLTRPYSKIGEYDGADSERAIMINEQCLDKKQNPFKDYAFAKTSNGHYYTDNVICERINVQQGGCLEPFSKGYPDETCKNHVTFDYPYGETGPEFNKEFCNQVKSEPPILIDAKQNDYLYFEYLHICTIRGLIDVAGSYDLEDSLCMGGRGYIVNDECERIGKYDPMTGIPIVENKEQCDMLDGNWDEKQNICDSKYGKENEDIFTQPMKNAIFDEFAGHYDYLPINNNPNMMAMEKITLSTPSLWNRFSKFNKGKPYSEKIKPFNFVLIGFGNIKDPKTGEIIKPLAPYQNPAKHAVYGDFIDCNAKTGKIMRGKEYWKNLYKTISEYDRHPESKLEGDIGTLNTKEIFVSDVIHIGKESNKLEDLGLDSESYVIYENKFEIERKFKELIPLILKLEPKDVKPFGISRQTLWNVKNNISLNQIMRTSLKTQIQFFSTFFILP